MLATTDLTEQVHDRIIERRRGLRIPQQRPVKIYEPTAARYLPGRTRDISATGLCIELPVSSAIGHGRVINVHVGLNEAGQPLANRRQMIPARVVWLRRQVRHGVGSLCIGVEFLAGIGAQRDAA